ncbi:thiol:disulfide interchange protein TlpA [Chthonobacter albigriseus]|uniref:thiol:disulfide interchange protein TlpA n=1 Tax=Chthonobacter albigriseus TaxID=1683161 RepID=UPI001FCE36C6|nr:TlpA disulfide reductase family protein [Chthonobacter albigriseus]
MVQKQGLGLIAAAAVAGLAAGLAGVYVTGWGQGNDEAGICAPSTAQAAALKPFASGDLAAFLPAETPVPLGSLAFMSPDGAPMTLADLEGRTVLLNLWATWCGPCRKEMPALDRLQAELGSERFEVVAVNVDLGGPEKPDAFLEETGIKALARYRDPTMKIFNDLKTRGLAFGMPTTLLIDAKGCQIGALHGPAEWDSPAAKALIGAGLGS